MSASTDLLADTNLLVYGHDPRDRAKQRRAIDVLDREVCRGAIQHGLAFWDALIWAAAKLNQVPYILTEDAPHGRYLEGVRYLYPFVPGFDDRLLG